MRFLSAELKMVEGPFCGKGCCSAVACRKAIGLGRNKKRPFVFPWPLRPCSATLTLQSAFYRGVSASNRLIVKPHFPLVSETSRGFA